MTGNTSQILEDYCEVVATCRNLPTFVQVTATCLDMVDDEDRDQVVEFLYERTQRVLEVLELEVLLASSIDAR
jgi:hypothetical protein